MDLPVGVSGASAVAVAHDCAEAASAIIRQGFGAAALAGVKGRGNVVTETDLEAERIVLSMLGSEFPAHAILSEETAGDVRSDGWMWVVDPLDGTKNFSRGIPHFGFNIALCFGSRPVLGLTAHPLLRDVFLSVEGTGAAMNLNPVSVSECASVMDAVVAIDMGYDAERGARQLDLARQLWPGMQSLRTSGSAALGFAYVAAGKWDIYVHSDLQPWDVAAGLALVREAGGVVHDRTGAEATIYSREAVAANPLVLADFERLAHGLPWE
jgi:fructose-1,6-bisphosphatase/inositol monophosphatase family enzyme